MKWFENLFRRARGLEVEKPKANNFDIAMKLVLGFEGGYSDHKNDRGGATNFGVIQATYDHYRQSRGLKMRPVKEIEAHEVREIYHGYWAEAGCEAMPLKAGIVVFDMAINSGSSRARKYWKLSGYNVDHFLELREGFYRNLVARDTSQKVFLNGWLNRIKHLREVIARVK